MKNIIRRLSVFIVIICVFINCSISFFADASYLPGLAIGETVSNAAGYFRVDIGSFLSHVLDESIDAASENLGRIWNDVVDSGYCPASDTHRHSFVYGLTSTSIYADADNIFDALSFSSSSGYYCYCEHCGQLAGDLISQNISDSEIDFEGSEGSITVYPSVVGVSNSLSAPDEFYSYGVDFESSIAGSPYVSYVNSGYVDESYLEFGRSNTNTSVYYWFGFDYSNIDSTLSIDDVVAYFLYHYTVDSLGRTHSYSPPVLIPDSNTYIFGDNYCLFRAITANSSVSWMRLFCNYDNCFKFVISIDSTDISDRYNYDNIQAPIVYNVDGDAIFGGYSSDIVDQSNNKYYNPNNNTYYDFSDASYDYSTNTYTLTVPDFDNDGTDENSTVTVVYGPGGLTVTDPSGTYDLYYFTNTQTPVNTVTNTSSSGTISGTIDVDVNVDVNQVANDTDAYITTHEDIPDGLYTLRERLAIMFSAFPDMIGDVGSFLNDAFDYVPNEIRWVLGFGMTCAVFVGIFKLFFR